jgi:hypothetical protein
VTVPATPVILVARGDGPPPALVDALVVEDDRELILGAAPTVTDSGESVDGLVRAMGEARPRRPGTVVLRGRRPLRIHAVVHDLEREPTWQTQWVGEALVAALEAAEERRVGVLGMPLLGRVHGRLPVPRGVALLADALQRVRPRSLIRLWLMHPPAREPGRLFEPLQEAGFRVLQVWDRSAAG